MQSVNRASQETMSWIRNNVAYVLAMQVIRAVMGNRQKYWGIVVYIPNAAHVQHKYYTLLLCGNNRKLLPKSIMSLCGAQSFVTAISLMLKNGGVSRSLISHGQANGQIAKALTGFALP